MKQLTCEMCGSTELIKQDGVFVCQTCGCKYSVEEARKMMVEGTVDVKGTVAIDNTALSQKSLENARRARAKEDWEETERYYNIVEQNDPKNIEAIFFSAYGKAMSTLVEDNQFKREAAFKILCNSVSVIDDNYDPNNEGNESAILDMARSLATMIASSFVYTQKKNGYGVVVSSNKTDTYLLFSSVIHSFTESINNIAKVDDTPYLHEALGLLYLQASRLGKVGLLLSFNHYREKGEQQLHIAKAMRYWNEHPEERDELKAKIAPYENELSPLREELKSLQTELAVVAASIPKMSGGDVNGRNYLLKEIDSYERKLKGSYFTKASKKKDESILDELTKNLAKIEARYNSPEIDAAKERKAELELQISPLNERIAQLEGEMKPYVDKLNNPV